ncbi:hypothetical protein [Streptococcus massiliensis]|uniref:Replication initiation and membrane attachment protein n=1 Tax=Streptococcus massiliensis TaxID=313439 RepID=A0A380KZH7_9STRE|nr:hypothetical protein [Streptococcus massiliensis]SUN76699.1 replication initiation and membrane attachment protein [Streptococcus massiliensis]
MRPNELFTYVKNNRIYPDEWSLMACYRPLLGQMSTDVYHYLLIFGDNGQVTHGFHEVLNHLNISMPQLEQALKNLIALGLMELYQGEKAYALKFLPLLSSEEFLANSIYVKLLENKIGEAAVNKLRLTQPSGRIVESSFSEIFSLNDVQKTVSSMDSSKKKAPSFDLEAFKQLMAREQLRFENEQEAVLQLFAIAEEQNWTWYETFILAKETAHNQVISVKRMQQKLAQTKVTENFTQQERTIIAEAKRQKPLQFLAELKQARKGMILQSERQVLHSMGLLGLLDEVINIILLFSFSKSISANLNEKYSLKLANDFSSQDIKSAEEAVLKIREIRSAKQDRNRQVNQKKPASNVPDWSNPDYKNETSTEQQAKLEEQKRRLLAKLDGGGD